MWVLLKRNWFCPGGYRIKRSNPANNPVHVPDRYKDALPSGAEIVEDGGPQAPRKREREVPRTLSEASKEWGEGSLATEADQAAHKAGQRSSPAAAEAIAKAARESGGAESTEEPVGAEDPEGDAAHAVSEAEALQKALKSGKGRKK